MRYDAAMRCDEVRCDVMRRFDAMFVPGFLVFGMRLAMLMWMGIGIEMGMTMGMRMGMAIGMET